MCFKRLVHKFLVLVLVWAGVMSSAACSVLEDRSACPCFVHVDLSSDRNHVCDSLRVMLDTRSGFCYRGTVLRSEYGRDLCVEVPSREGVYISVLDGSVEVDSGTGGLPSVVIPVGEQCPEVYMYTSFLETNAESVADTVVVGKNYCSVVMNFAARNLDLYEVHIVGNVCGYGTGGDEDGFPGGGFPGGGFPGGSLPGGGFSGGDLPDGGSPGGGFYGGGAASGAGGMRGIGMVLCGYFDYSPLTDDPESCSFRLPRQMDNSLQLVISAPGAPRRTFALGNYIARSGYDWNAYDLDDIIMNLDFAENGFTVTVGEWTITEEFDVLI